MKQYTLESTKIAGKLLLSYEGGKLKAIELAFKPALNSFQFEALKQELPLQESDIAKLEKIGLRVINQQATNEKIGLFCKLYEAKFGIKYKVSAADTGKIKRVDVNEALLNTYFSSENFLYKNKWSISNLVKYYNELRLEHTKGPAGKFPNSYSAAVAQKLSGQELVEYWKHLRDLGLSAVKDRLGNVVDFR
ncbi:hypothetical protein [Peijinzhouia sedimentorum]